MAINRFSVHIGTKGKASPHFNYITASEKYEHKTGVVYTQSGNMPKWARDDPAKFWAAADEHERANGQTYKEHIISIPRELPSYSRQRFVNEWIFKELGNKHPYTYAMHETVASDGKTNPHAHIMFSTRELDKIERTPEQFFKRYNAKDPSRGGAKKAETGLSRGEMKKNLEEQRQRWTEHNAQFARDFLYTIDDRPNNPTPNKSMAEIQKEQKLDTMLEQHPWYISPEPVPPFVPAPEPPPPPPTTETPRGESLADKYARENAQNAQNAFYIDDEPEPIPTPTTPPPRPQATPQRDDSFDFGM